MRKENSEGGRLNHAKSARLLQELKGETCGPCEPKHMIILVIAMMDRNGAGMHGVSLFFLDKEPRPLSSSPPCFPGASHALSSMLFFSNACSIMLPKN